jgi:hypothetical protein
LSNQDKHIDDVLRQAAQGAEPLYTIPSWDGIEAGLLKAERKRKLVVWWWSAASILFIGFLGLLWINQLDEGKVTNGVRDNDNSSVTAVRPQSVQSNKDSVDLDIDDVKDKSSELEFVETAVVPKDQVAANTRTKSSEENKYEGSNVVGDDNDTEIVQKEIASNDKGGIDQTPIPVIAKEAFDSAKNENAVDIDDDVKYSSKMPIDEPGSQKFRGFWELGLSASPGLASNFVGVNNENKWLINKKYFDVTQNEKTSFAYQVDFHINRFVSEQFYIGSGLRFVERGEHVVYNYRRDSGVVIRENIKQLEYFPLAAPLIQDIQHEGNNKMQFIEIPLRFGWMQPLANKLRVKSELSVNYSYLLNANGKKVNGTELLLEDLNSFANNKHGYGFACQTGLLFGLGARSELSGNIHYSMNLNSWRAKSSGLVERPYNYGVTIGWNYKLGSTK